MNHNEKKTAEPLGAYLYSLPEAPLMPEGTYPLSGGALFYLAGGGSKYPYTQLDYWRAYLRSAPRLKAWLRSGKAYLPPESWPCRLAFPEHLTPEDFHRCVLPRPGKEGRTSNPLRLCPGLPELMAWAHGWPVHPQDWPKMVEASEWLMSKTVFIIWAYNLAVECVPLPFSDKYTLVKRMALRQVLEENPLNSGPMTINNTLPKWATVHTTLISMVPARGPGVGPSNRTPLDGTTLPCYTGLGDRL